MPLDTWFPLAVYYTDLDDADQHNPKLKNIILELEKNANERRFEKMAWTGDVHGVSSLHYDERFDWLTNHVEQHCIAYLTELGYDLEKIDLYIQRSWPVISRKDESVAVHAHHNANVSAVYYVDVPVVENEEDAGPFVLYNTSSPNEIQEGMSSNSTNAIADWNEYNYKQGYYLPQAGRLLLFPSKQMHSVHPNKTDDLRISTSFDIVITASDSVERDTLEFLQPPPERWKAFAKKD